MKTRAFRITALLTVAAFLVWFFIPMNSFATSMNDTVPEDPKWRPYEQLVTDVNRDDIAGVQDDLQHGVNPNAYPSDGPAIQNENDLTALCLASSGGNIEMVTLLLDHRADPNLGDGWFDSPLTAAASSSHVDVMNVLIARGAHVNDKNGNSDALWSAVRDNKLDAIRFLLAHGANANTHSQGSVLSAAVASHKTAAAEILRRSGAK